MKPPDTVVERLMVLTTLNTPIPPIARRVGSVAIKAGLLTADHRVVTPSRIAPVAFFENPPRHSGGTVQDSHLLPY